MYRFFRKSIHANSQGASVNLLDSQTTNHSQWKLTIHSGISIFPDNDTQRKVYFGHISEDRDHDQVFVIKCLEDIGS